MKRQLMYIENKSGDVDGARARVGWVTFSKTGRTVYYQGKSLQRANETEGHHLDVENGDEYWVSSVKKPSSNGHYVVPVDIEVDDDALKEYQRIKSRKPQV